MIKAINGKDAMYKFNDKLLDINLIVVSEKIMKRIPIRKVNILNLLYSIFSLDLYIRI